MKLNQVTLPCSDFDASVAFYRLLGLRLIVNSPPRYARLETSDGTTLSLHVEAGLETPGKAIVYFEVDDVDSKVRELIDRGVAFETEPVDQDWLWREAHLHDPAGNRLCIYTAGDNRRYPPWRVEQPAEN